MAALQFAGVAWIVLNQFRERLGLHAGEASGLVAKGYIGAGLFFVALGFFLAEVWPKDAKARGRALLRATLFAQPLSLAVLAVMAAVVAGGGALLGGLDHQGSFRWIDLMPSLFLVQGWGTLSTDCWNFPSWLVSAWFFALLAFPVMRWAAMKAPRMVSIIAPLALFFALFAFEARAGRLFTDLTAKAGILQALPAGLLGAALWRLNREAPLSRTAGALLAAASLAWILAAASLRLSDLLIWPAFAPLVLGAAAARLPGRPWMARAAITLQLVYLPADILWFHAWSRLLPNPSSALAWALWW
ncbi:MAG: hypothetical protein ACREEH_11060, partial [Caulobacteraceae bacterium]